MTINNLTDQFINRAKGQCHNARTYRSFDDVQIYTLHYSDIAQLDPDGTLTLSWCGWRTPTTQNHLKKIYSAWTQAYGQPASPWDSSRTSSPDNWKGTPQ